MTSVAAPIVAGAYILIASWVGMPIDQPWLLWGFSTLMIFGVSSFANMTQALAGSVGLFLNMFIFVILAMLSAGGAVPLEASPPFFRWLSLFEPMRQVFVGSRSVLYFDGNWDAGLAQAVIAASTAIVVAITAGLIGTTIYERRGLSRGTFNPAPEGI